MNFAQQLAELTDQMAIAHSIISEAYDRGYFNEHTDDSEQETDLKQTARDWLRAFNGEPRSDKVEMKIVAAEQIEERPWP